MTQRDPNQLDLFSTGDGESADENPEVRDPEEEGEGDGCEPEGECEPDPAKAGKGKGKAKAKDAASKGKGTTPTAQSAAAPQPAHFTYPFNIRYAAEYLDLTGFEEGKAYSPADIKKVLVKNGFTEFQEIECDFHHASATNTLVVTIRGSRKGGSHGC